MDPRFNWNFDLGVRTNETPKRPKLRRTWKRSLEVHTPSFFWVGSEPVKSDFSDRKPSSWDQDFYQWRGKSLKSYCGPLQRPYSGWSEPKSWSAFDPLSGSWVNRSEKILTRVFLIGWRKTSRATVKVETRLFLRLFYDRTTSVGCSEHVITIVLTVDLWIMPWLS